MLAVCPIVEGALLRFLLRLGESSSNAALVIDALHDAPGCEFWADEASYRDVDLTAVHGHRQVTDAYLAQLARHRRARLVTLDRGLALAHPDVALLIEP